MNKTWHVRNRPCFALSGLYQAFGKFYFTISKFSQEHEYLQYNKKLKQNQNSCSINPPLPCPQKRIPTVTNIETDNNNKKTQTPTERRNNWICREQRVQSFEKRRIIGLFVREERSHPPWPGSIKTITTQSGGGRGVIQYNNGLRAKGGANRA